MPMIGNERVEKGWGNVFQGRLAVGFYAGRNCMKTPLMVLAVGWAHHKDTITSETFDRN
jgi:hypothetical protein